MLLFKYVGPRAMESVLGDSDYVSLRFNFPRNYNDPYELFLTPDDQLDDESQASFEFFTRQLPQAPVSCFSKRPDSVVMWAHYCRDAAGVCIALDEEALVQEFDHVWVGDVEYSDEPATISAALIQTAAVRKKARHAEWLLAAANRAAYFKKRAAWRYEEERRVIVPSDGVEDIDGLLLANISATCVRAVVVGPNTEAEARRFCRQWAGAAEVEYLELHYGKSTYAPFFTSTKGSFVWDGTRFSQVESTCENCGEPLEAGNESQTCSRCRLTPEEILDEGHSNMLMLMIRHGVTQGLPLAFAGIDVRGRAH